MQHQHLLSTLVLSIALTGCASQTNWAPVVDTAGDPNAARINQDIAQCKELALKASGGTAKETAIGAGVGGLIGAAAGAALGAAVGSPGTGAALGAAAGGFGGGAKQGLEAEDKYKQAYNNCLRGRGHRVLN